MRGTDRQMEAVVLRDSGLSFRAVGEEMGICPASAASLIRHGRDALRVPDRFPGLSLKVQRRLCWSGFDTKEKVLAAVTDGSLHYQAKPNISNYGKACHKIVCEWLGDSLPRKEETLGCVGVPKAIEYLEKRGYTVTSP